LAELFGDVLRLCDRVGLVKPGVVSIDGTRIAGNASPEVNHEFDRIAREIVAEARATDEREDELYGEACGDELPEELRTPEGRREFFRRARSELRGEQKASGLTDEAEAEKAAEVPLEFDAAKIVARTQGREGWPREGKRQLERHRWRHPDPIPRARVERLLLAAERLEAELEVERRANEAYEHYSNARPRATGSVGGRAAGRSGIGRRSCRLRVNCRAAATVPPNAAVQGVDFTNAQQCEGLTSISRAAKVKLLTGSHERT